MIDPHTGAWSTDDGNVFPPKMDEAAFLASAPGRSATKVGANNGWSRYALAVPQWAAARRWGATLYFHNGKLAKVMLALVPDAGAQGWSAWSEAAELARDLEHQQVLSRILGSAPHQYAWGQVFASYDPRAASSSISIIYL